LTIVNLLISGHLERNGTFGKHACTKAPEIEPATRGAAGDAKRHIRSVAGRKQDQLIVIRAKAPDRYVPRTQRSA
jgi:hypothetical protein